MVQGDANTRLTLQAISSTHRNSPLFQRFIAAYQEYRTHGDDDYPVDVVELGQVLDRTEAGRQFLHVFSNAVCEA